MKKRISLLIALILVVSAPVNIQAEDTSDSILSDGSILDAAEADAEAENAMESVSESDEMDTALIVEYETESSDDGADTSMVVSDIAAGDNPEITENTDGTNGISESNADATADTDNNDFILSVEECSIEDESGISVIDDDDDSLIQLATPANLEWGVFHLADGTVLFEMPGTASFTVNGLTQDKYQLVCYKINEDGASKIVRCTGPGQYTCNFPLYISESGTYYFTVQSLGDGVTYSDSEIASSGEWTVELASEQLPSPTSLTWQLDESTGYPAISWDTYEDESNLWGFELHFYVSDTADGTTKTPLWGHTCTGAYPGYRDISYSDTLDAGLLSVGGSGYYFVEIHAISKDITAALHSDVVWSDGFYFRDIVGEISETLDTIDSSATEAEIKSVVQNIDTSELSAAMASDQDNTGVVAQIASLEAQAGVSTNIVITDAMSDNFDSSQVSVIGGGLNTSSGNAELTISTPEDGDVIDTMLKNSIAFSMNLAGEDVDSNQLSVPVKITLPIPATINPDFFVLLHYHQGEEEPEQLWPYIYEKDGQYYASFVITSFSDFVMYDSSPAVDLSNFTVTLSSSNYTYDGEAKTPDVTVTDGTSILIKDTDYTVSYSNNTDVGTATVTVTGIGNYTGTATTAFTIVKEAIQVGASISIDKLSYTVTASDSSEMTVTLSAPESKTITSATIPATVTIDGNTYTVTAIADNAFSGCTSLTSVSVGANVTSIGSKAFYNCTSLKTVSGNAAVTTIGSSAFQGCTALTTVNGMTHLITIGSNAFYNCKKLTTIGSKSSTVTLASVQTIGKSTFYGCKALKKVNLTSKALFSIGASAFQGCKALKTFTAKSTVLKSIGKKAFYGDKKLSTVSLKTSKLTKSNVKSNAFKGIKSTCTFKVPSKKVSAYKKIFRARGAGSKIKVKKL
ncbi:MAG: leucine-rich repeat protein [Lachnospiraceae bacterium]|nr:leucine-rich repeat protein [Lachnospiraceae bacterium]